eukprot:TRINITY_DN645_c1_g1_i3.p1 TRINITY_DN645_c1_g1~~TRINITY_DN645_c1_g1_i3.p1  ORF type:complete len:717 (-),score=235.65 TRINITY_DN645_c1_g1_i3:282-2432(-)
MKIFVSHVDTFVGRVLCALLNSKGHKVCGTVSTPNAKEALPSFLRDIVSIDEDPAEYKQALVTSDCVIFDMVAVGVEATSYAFKVVNSAILGQKVVFICLSSYLSWANTFPPRKFKEEKEKKSSEGDEAEEEAEAEEEEEEEEEPPIESVTEDQFHRRKPHKSYKKHKEAEKLITSGVKNPMLKTYVVFPGLTYGEGEDILHNVFRAGWLLHPEKIPILSRIKGKNSIPMIHVFDLSNLLLAVAVAAKDEEGEPPESPYIFAVDDGKQTYADIVNKVAEVLGNGSGSVEFVKDEEQLVMMENEEFLSADVQMDLGVGGELEFEWRCREGFVESMETIVKEYKRVRNLDAVRMLITGPPGSGKSVIAAELSSRYRVERLRIDHCIAEYEEAHKPRPSGGGDGDEEGDGDDEGGDAAAGEPLERNPEGRLTDASLVRVMLWKLTRPSCRNQGFLLDGFPKTYKQARMLFTDREAEDDTIEEPEEEYDANERIEVNKRILPEIVVSLDTTNTSVLRERVMNKGSSSSSDEDHREHDDEAGFERRLEAYRAANTEVVSVVHFFDVHDVLLLEIDCGVEGVEEVTETILQKVGEPRNFGPSEEELMRMEEERLRKEAKAEAEKAEAEKAHQKRLEEESLALEARTERNQQRAEAILKREREALEARSGPLRQYLLDNVVPVLTRGLIEVSRIRPEDPIDFLAEFLFRSQMDGGRSTTDSTI